MPLLMIRMKKGGGEMPLIKILSDSYHVIDPSKSWLEHQTPELRRQTFRVVD